MGTFRTKLDFSNNRQVKQRIETITNLSGATTFGVPFGDLPTGPNPALSSITQSISNVLGTFSGNSGTTVFTWTDSRFNLGDSSFSAITPTNSGDTQNSGNVFTPVTSSLFTVDGNSGYTQYSGVSFTMYPTTFIGLGGGAYSGELGTYISQIIDATGLDFSGRTIWNDVSGITRTDRLIISDDAYIGKVFMCNSSEGMGKWETLSGLTATTALWTNDGVGGGAIRSTNGVTHTITGNSDYSIIAGGFGHKIYSTELGFIGGGAGNKIDTSDTSFTVGGDDLWVVNSQTGGIVGGQANYLADSQFTIIAGGSGHQLINTSNWSSIIGGRFNEIDNARWSTVVGGTIGVISGGTMNGIFSTYSSYISGSSLSHIIGGRLNLISGGLTGNTYDAIYGGNNNIINNHSYSTIINGSGNTIHFDLADFNYPHALEMIENSKDSIISASTMSKISSSNSMTIANSILSTVISSAAGGFDPDPYLTSGGIIGTDNPDDNGVNTIISSYEGLIRYKAASNTIIGSTIARIDGTAGGTGGANSNFIGNSGSVTISDQYNTSGSSIYNNIFGSYASGMRTPNSYSSIMNSSYVNMEYSDTSSIISSKDSSISTGITSSIIGGTGHTLTTTESSMILGGALNTIDTANYSIIAGGSGNTVTKNTDNLTQPKYSGIFAGKNNKIIPRFGSGSDEVSGSYCAIVGGEGNTVSGHSWSFIGGGQNNLISCDAGYNAIIGGSDNVNHASHGVIIGGYGHILSANTACPTLSDNSVIIGGNFNYIGDAVNTVILGGQAISGTASNTVYAPNMVIGTGGTTSILDIYGNARIRSIGSSASSGALHYTADGTLTTNTSDERLKTNITTLTGALDKVNQLRGVTYNWTENPNGDARIGFIAQEVNSVVPELTFTNPNSSENYMGVHYDNVTALLVEAVKELSSGITTSNNTHLETQTILAEDNNIELNFNGTQQTAIGGGLSILHAKGQDQSADLITDADGNFVTNNDFKPQALTIPLYTPTSSNDTAGSEGNITRDDNYLYVKSSNKWKRVKLEEF